MRLQGSSSPQRFVAPLPPTSAPAPAPSSAPADSPADPPAWKLKAMDGAMVAGAVASGMGAAWLTINSVMAAPTPTIGVLLIVAGWLGGNALLAKLGIVPRALFRGAGVEQQPPVEPGSPRLMPADLPYEAYDGAYAGRDGASYDANLSRIGDIPPVVPAAGVAATGKTVVYVNGAWTPREQVNRQMQWVADATGDNVVGIINASWGSAWKDFLQTIGDKLGIGPNPAKETIIAVIDDQLIAQQPISFATQSQAAATVGRSLHEVDVRLARDQGLRWDFAAAAQERQESMSVVSLDTYGGAGHAFPDGPHYRHFVNRRDPFVQVGVGNDVARALQIARPGKDAVLVQFSSRGPAKLGPFLGPHVLPTYLAEIPKDKG